MTILRIILAILVPPVAVFLTVGLALPFWINLGLSLLFLVPGIFHALWVLMKAAKTINKP